MGKMRKLLPFVQKLSLVEMWNSFGLLVSLLLACCCCCYLLLLACCCYLLLLACCCYLLLLACCCYLLLLACCCCYLDWLWGLQRDWVVLLAGTNWPVALAQANAILSRIDLLCEGLEIIPSDNFTSLSVMQAVGSVMTKTNKYSEGYRGARYYGGNEYIDNLTWLRDCVRSVH